MAIEQKHIYSEMEDMCRGLLPNFKINMFCKVNEKGEHITEFVFSTSIYIVANLSSGRNHKEQIKYLLDSLRERLEAIPHFSKLKEDLETEKDKHKKDILEKNQEILELMKYRHYYDLAKELK